MIRITFSLFPFLLMGCAAALVPESNSPRTKIDQATILFNEQGRPLAALKLLQQAISLAREQKDTPAEAEAEFYLAEIYKNPGEFGRASAIVRDAHKAVEHHTRAVNLYSELKHYKKASFVMFNRAGAYDKIPDPVGVCRSFIEAKKLYEKPAVAEDVLPRDLSDGVLLEEIKAQIQQNKCK